MKKRMSKSILCVLLAFSILWIHCGGDKNPVVPDESRDPEKNFEVLWQTFEDNYAFFKLRNVDWYAQYQTFRPQVNPNTTDDELFNIMSEMLRPFEDGHVSLCRSRSVCYSPGIPHPLAARLQEYRPIIEGYLKNDFVTADNERFVYGKLTETIGYLAILHMGGSLVEQARLLGVLDEIMPEFKDFEALIIDVRFNPGGTDPVSLIIANRFADQKRLAFTKQTRNGGYEDFTPVREFFVEPYGAVRFTKKIVLLTSKVTASAAEIFTLSLMPFPYVTRIGEPTNGIFSDIFNGTLPNGWDYGLSHQRYFSHEGVNYEKIGIPPDIEIFMTKADLTAGKDSILGVALQLLQAN